MMRRYLGLGASSSWLHLEKRLLDSNTALRCELFVGAIPEGTATSPSVGSVEEHGAP